MGRALILLRILRQYVLPVAFRFQSAIQNVAHAAHILPHECYKVTESCGLVWLKDQQIL